MAASNPTATIAFAATAVGVNPLRRGRRRRVLSSGYHPFVYIGVIGVLSSLRLLGQSQWLASRLSGRGCGLFKSGNSTTF